MLYFERNGRLNFAKIVLGCAKPGLRKLDFSAVVDVMAEVDGMGGECRMAGVAVATATLAVPHQHFALLSLLATPTLTCWLTILCRAGETGGPGGPVPPPGPHKFYFLGGTEGTRYL